MSRARVAINRRISGPFQNDRSAVEKLETEFLNFSQFRDHFRLGITDRVVTGIVLDGVEFVGTLLNPLQVALGLGPIIEALFPVELEIALAVTLGPGAALKEVGLPAGSSAADNAIFQFERAIRRRLLLG